jgi:O-antigen/teichoic acid export membrane protein
MSFAKYSIQTFITRGAVTVLGMVTGIISARWLGPEGVGILALVLLIKEFSFRFFNLGFGSAFAFYVASKKVSTQQIMKLLWIVSTVMTFISVIVILVIWRQNFSPWNDMHPHLFYLCLPLIPLLFFSNYMQRVLSGELRITELNIANFVMGTTKVFFLIILVVLLEMGVAGAIFSLVLSDLSTFFYLLLQCSKSPAQACKTEWSESGVGTLALNLWRYGRWNYLIMFANFFVGELPLIILKKLSAYNAPIGLFARARGVGRLSRLVTLPVSQVLFPYTAASEKAEASNRTNVLCRNILLLMLLGVGVAVLVIKPLIILLYGEEFIPAAKIFYTLAPGIVFWPLGHFLGVHVAASGKPKRIFLASSFNAVVAAVICWLLIPRYGAIGAGLSASSIYFVQALLSIIIYVNLTGAHFTEALFVRKSDRAYYQRIYKLLASRFIDKFKAS